MENILEAINMLFIEDKAINLKNNSTYQFIGISETKVKGITYKSISYKISDKNSKKVTENFLLGVLKFYDVNKHFPDRNWYKENFKFEIESRPCNKSVAENFISKLRAEQL